jgi:hypothetical protein
LLIAGAGAVVALVAVLLWPREREPSYQGKTLSEWLDIYEFSKGDGRASEAGDKAIRAIGTNAIPFFVRCMETHPLSLEIRLARWLESRGWGGEREKRVLWWDGIRFRYGMKGFQVLGVIAGPAAPELARIVNQGGDPEVIRALECIGKDALPALAGLASNPDPRVSGMAVFILGHMGYLGRAPGSNARCVVPALIQALARPRDARDAAEALGEFGVESGVCVPALMRCMESPDACLRIVAARALASFGKEARPAVPLIVRTLEDESMDVWVKEGMRYALRVLAPEVLEENGTIAYYVQVESSEPGVRIEVNNDYVGETPITVKICCGDKDGTFHNFGSSEYVIRAYAANTNQFTQTKVFRTGGWFSQEDMIPYRVYFDMSEKTSSFSIDVPPKY